MTIFTLGNEFRRQKQPPINKGVLENFTNPIGRRLYRNFFFNKAASPRSFLQNTSEKLLLNRQLSLFPYTEINMYICNNYLAIMNIFSYFLAFDNFFAL